MEICWAIKNKSRKVFFCCVRKSKVINNLMRTWRTSGAKNCLSQTKLLITGLWNVDKLFIEEVLLAFRFELLEVQRNLSVSLIQNARGQCRWKIWTFGKSCLDKMDEVWLELVDRCICMFDRYNLNSSF